jgi:hypothetical protein
MGLGALDRLLLRLTTVTINGVVIPVPNPTATQSSPTPPTNLNIIGTGISGAFNTATGSYDVTITAGTAAGVTYNPAQQPDYGETNVQTAIDDLKVIVAGAHLTNLSNGDALIIAPGWYVLPAGTLSANHTATLETGGVFVAGSQVTITRQDTTAHTYQIINGGVGGGTWTLPASTFGFIKCQFDGTNWAMREIGTSGTTS